MRTVIMDATSKDVLKAVEAIQNKGREAGEAVVLTRKSPTEILVTFHPSSCSRAFREKIRKIADEVGEEWPVYNGEDPDEVFVNGLLVQAVREEAENRGAQDVNGVLHKTLLSWLELIFQNMPDDPEVSICEALSTYDITAILERALERNLEESTSWVH